MATASTGARLERRFSVPRFVGGIAMILLALGVVGGCTYASQRGGLTYLIIALPGLGIGLALMAKPYRLVCRTCQVKAGKNWQSAPFPVAMLGHVQAAAGSGDAALLADLLRRAPLLDPPPAAFCVLASIVCPRCLAAGYLQVATYKTSVAKAGAAPFTVIDQVPVEHGAEIGPAELQLMAEGGAARWAATKQYLGIDNPSPMRL